MKLLHNISDILEWVSDEDEYDFTIKGRNISEDDALVFIDFALQDYGENLKVSHILRKKEEYYYVTRYYDGSDAQDEGHNCWIFIEEKYKKGYGYCTTFTVKLIRYEDE